MTYNRDMTLGVSRVNRQLNTIGSSWLIDLQLRSDWEFALAQCIVLNSDSSKLNIIVLLITDSVLLLMVLVGLLRLRGEGVGTSGLGRLLLKQVGVLLLR
jgi:hypothetical protein